MRLFVAIKFSDQFLDEIDKIVKPLRDKFPEVDWTKRENIHLTLKFLGETKVGVLQIKEAIDKVADYNGVFKLVLEKFGYFDREQLIVWVGFEKAAELTNLVNNLDSVLAKLGFTRERKIYTPHVTLGRGKRLSTDKKDAIKNLINDLNVENEIEVFEILLIKSILTKNGPIYEMLYKFRLS